MFDAKSLAGDALSKLKSEPSVEVEAEPAGDEVDALGVAAEDVMAAFKSGSADSLKSALMSFMDLYQAPPAMPGMDE